MTSTPVSAQSRIRSIGSSLAETISRAAVVGAALALAGAALVGSMAPGGLAPGSLPPQAVVAAGRPPVLAYYYMWFNAASWTRAKTDLPALGPYASTDPAVIRQQVTWARESGVDAFIASWKHTPTLDLALSELVAECQRQGLKLVLIYEGLDVNRNPIPVSTVQSDLLWFRDHYGLNPVFDVFGKPAVIWSGTWKFTADQIAPVRAAVGAPGTLLLLGSEKDAASYRARTRLFDGDAYYWSSADPNSTPGYQKRLDALGAAVHAGHGLWLAPAAVGFDARLNGGTSVVDRRDGATLRQAWADALATGPDGVALISWNEYTENSYVEPSRDFGLRYLQVLASLTGAAGPAGSPGSAGTPGSAGASTPPGASAPPTPAATARPSHSPRAGGAGGVTSGAPPDFGPALGAGSSSGSLYGSLLVGGLILTAIAGLGFRMRRRPSLAPSGSDDRARRDD